VYIDVITYTPTAGIRGLGFAPACVYVCVCVCVCVSVFPHITKPNETRITELEIEMFHHES